MANQCHYACNKKNRGIEPWLCYKYWCVHVGRCSSSLCRIISGVPQVSVLKLVSLIFYFNDTFRWISGNVSVKLFAVVAKIYSVIDNVNFFNQWKLLSDLASQTDHWLVEFSFSKCSMRRSNSKRTAIITPYLHSLGHPPSVSAQYSDFRVSNYRHLSYTSHVSRNVIDAASRANAFWIVPLHVIAIHSHVRFALLCNLLSTKAHATKLELENRLRQFKGCLHRLFVTLRSSAFMVWLQYLNIDNTQRRCVEANLVMYRKSFMSRLLLNLPV